MDGVRRIKSEKLWKYQCREEYAWSLERKQIEWDGESNVEHMCNQVKQAMVESSKDVCALVRVRVKKQKSMCEMMR